MSLASDTRVTKSGTFARYVCRKTGEITEQRDECATASVNWPPRERGGVQHPARGNEPAAAGARRRLLTVGRLP